MYNQNHAHDDAEKTVWSDLSCDFGSQYILLQSHRVGHFFSNLGHMVPAIASRADKHHRRNRVANSRSVVCGCVYKSLVNRD